ncbi:MAG: translation initiation factor IF-3 [Planctomycetes bacterium]|nr:translation initiation factor IF-3 [Planctomycetota bacterium]
MRHTPSAPPRDSHRVNEQIRLSPVFVIDDENEQLGEMDTREALALARERGLDLVEVAANQRPPVCRIMDYGKFKYEAKKKAVASKKKQHQVVLKEVRLRPKTATGDLMVKVERARKFLEAGDKVQVTCLFRGREMAHQEVGLDVMRRFYEQLEDIAKIEREPRLEGRRMNMIVSRGTKKGGAPKASKPARDPESAPTS